MNLNQVTVPSLDLTRAVPFYQQLGLKLIVRSPHYARFECPDGDATFSIQQVAQLSGGGEGVHVYFECERLDEYVADLVSKGVDFKELPVDKSWLWREARLEDPDGNHLVLFYAGTNRKNPPWRIG